MVGFKVDMNNNKLKEIRVNVILFIVDLLYSLCFFVYFIKFWKELFFLFVDKEIEVERK